MRNFTVLSGILAENDRWSGLEDKLIRFTRNEIGKQIGVFKTQQGRYGDENIVNGQFKTDYPLYHIECDGKDRNLLLGFFLGNTVISQYLQKWG